MPPETDSQPHGLTTPLEGVAAEPFQPGEAIPAPLRLIRPTVPREWVDYNGHMSESCYLLAFSYTPLTVATNIAVLEPVCYGSL